MTYHPLRRRLSEAMAAHDWLEGVSTAIGLMFMVLGLACVWGLGTTMASWGEADPEGKATVGFLQVTRGFGVVLFAVLAFVAFGVGWFLAGDWIRRIFRRGGTEA